MKECGRSEGDRGERGGAHGECEPLRGGLPMESRERVV